MCWSPEYNVLVGTRGRRKNAEIKDFGRERCRVDASTKRRWRRYWNGKSKTGMGKQISVFWNGNLHCRWTWKCLEIPVSMSEAWRRFVHFFYVLLRSLKTREVSYRVNFRVFSLTVTLFHETWNTWSIFLLSPSRPFSIYSTHDTMSFETNDMYTA